MKPKKEKSNFTLLRLFVTGESATSQNAISNLNSIANEILPGKHKIEIVNALDDPARQFEEGVLVTPTLVIKKNSLPSRHVIGDLSDKKKIASSLQFYKEGDQPKTANKNLRVRKA